MLWIELNVCETEQLVSCLGREYVGAIQLDD